jgi:hypothetical protein
MIVHELEKSKPVILTGDLTFNQGNGPMVHHWNKLETTSVIYPLTFTLSGICMLGIVLIYLALLN